MTPNIVSHLPAAAARQCRQNSCPSSIVTSERPSDPKPFVLISFLPAFYCRHHPAVAELSPVCFLSCCASSTPLLHHLINEWGERTDERTGAAGQSVGQSVSPLTFSPSLPLSYVRACDHPAILLCVCRLHCLPVCLCLPFCMPLHTIRACVSFYCLFLSASPSLNRLPPSRSPARLMSFLLGGQLHPPTFPYIRYTYE